MVWNVISLIGTIVTILCAIASFLSWKSTKQYYHKIIIIEDVEKIDNALLDITDSKNQYNQILSIFGDDRGVESVDIIKKKFKKIKGYLESIRNEIPQKFEQIHKSLEEPISYIDGIIGGQLECKNSEKFRLLQSSINQIQKNLKIKKDELRGIN